MLQGRERTRGEQAGPFALGQLAQRDDARTGGRHEPPAVEDAAAARALPGWSRRRPGGPAQRAMTVSPADDPFPRRHEQVALGRHEDVHPRAELHQARPAGRWRARRPRTTRVTTRRAIRPTIWRKCTRRTSSPDLSLDGDVAALVEVRALVLVGGEPLARAARTTSTTRPP